MHLVRIIPGLLACTSIIAGSSALMAQAAPDVPSAGTAAQDTAAQSVAAQDAADPSQDDADTSDVVVTGSRVIANGNAAPTPVTVVQTERLLQTTPSSIPDALRQLPQFGGATGPATRNIGNAQGVGTGNFLSLRGFGSSRNLVLLDGNRMPPTSAGGAVDTDTIPQSLIQRVEVVTGGASAVYGSDAVTGVINFIIDKKFNGLKMNASAGISNFGDNVNYRVGGAFGTDVMDGRGHFEASLDYRDSKGIIGMDERPESAGKYIQTGAGTAANPYNVFANGRVLTGNRGSFITQVRNAAGAVINVPSLLDLTFNTNGIATKFVHGSPTGSAGQESGGDGGFYDYGTLVSPSQQTQAFARFDYNIADNLDFYAMGSYSTSQGKFPYASARFAVDILSGNPFIPKDIQALMTANNVGSIRLGRLQSKQDGLPGRMNDNFTRNRYEMAGLLGKFGNFNWEVNFINSESYQRVWNRGNTSWERIAAATDVVVDPATGRPTCQVLLGSQASRFQGCIPLNFFGPTATDPTAYAWAIQDTNYQLTQRMNDINASISGDLFSLWAGPIRASISGEMRWLTLDNVSSVESTDLANCTGLRANCTQGTTTLTQHDVSSSVSGKQNVKEIAGELLIPLLKDVPFVQAFELNLAARHTDYSISGPVNTWKIGATWEVMDGLRVRATRSRDIRAPSLVDLYSPVSFRPSGYTDIYTNTGGATTIVSQGNPDLVPEVAKTSTVGIVLQPRFLPAFSIAVDYYEILINNGISAANGTSTTIQRECIDSNGASPYCALYERPFGFGNTTPANYPTKVFSQQLNAARQFTKGVDVDMAYGFDALDLSPSMQGRFNLRAIVSYQPTFTSQTIRSQPVRNTAGIGGSSVWNATINVDYRAGPLGVAITERWKSKTQPTDRSFNVDLRPDIPALAYTDLSLSYRFDVGDITPFFTVQNLFNRKPVIVGDGAAVPGLFSGTVGDIIGRYFTGGVRARF